MEASLAGGGGGGDDKSPAACTSHVLRCMEMDVPPGVRAQSCMMDENRKGVVMARNMSSMDGLG